MRAGECIGMGWRWHRRSEAVTIRYAKKSALRRTPPGLPLERVCCVYVNVCAQVYVYRIRWLGGAWHGASIASGQREQ